VFLWGSTVGFEDSCLGEDAPLYNDPLTKRSVVVGCSSGSFFEILEIGISLVGGKSLQQLFGLGIKRIVEPSLVISIWVGSFHSEFHVFEDGDELGTSREIQTT
jgi:hypothetical protein